MFPGLICTKSDPAQHATTADIGSTIADDLDYLDRDLSDVRTLVISFADMSES